MTTRRQVLRGLAGGAAIAALRPVLRAAEPGIAPDHPAIGWSDHVALERAPDGAVRPHRGLDVPGRGYRWDNPGARLSFRTDARAVTVHLRYSDRHTSPTARSAAGVWLIDGRGDERWVFTSRATATQRAVEDLDLLLPVPDDGRAHDYAVVLPYGDSVDFRGLTLSPGARLERAAPRPAFRYVAYGDSVTHGFTASRVDRTFPYRVAERRGWQSVNLGLGGRTARPAEGAVIGALGGDVVTIFIGVNDWQGGIAPDVYRENMRGLLAGLRAKQPRVPVYVLTPLWVSDRWKPAKAAYPLESYRDALRTLVAELRDGGDAALRCVEGPELIDGDERYFDPVLVHPNDAGFAQLAERLAPRLQRE